MHKYQLVKNASYASVLASIIILIIKVIGFLQSSSASLFASFVDSLLDSSSSFVNMIAVHAALSPADDKHRFGHHKIQDLAVFGQGAIFILSGAYTLFISIKRIFIHQAIENHDFAVLSMLICSGIIMILTAYQSYVIKKTNSQIIKSDRIHYISDFASNIAVIISVYTSSYIYFIDSILASLIAFGIIFAAIKLLKDAIKNLIDEEFSDEEKKSILEILSNHPDVLDIHELKTRYAGNKAFIQFHIELDPNMSLVQAHYISEEIENRIRNIFQDSEIIIHQDPQGYDKEIQYKENLRKESKTK